MPVRLESIRAYERRDATVGFLMLLVMMAGHAALETARDGLFLTTLPATRLPWAYLAMLPAGDDPLRESSACPLSYS